MIDDTYTNMSRYAEELKEYDREVQEMTDAEFDAMIEQEQWEQDIAGEVDQIDAEMEEEIYWDEAAKAYFGEDRFDPWG